jgi:hypothetical protein
MATKFSEGFMKSGFKGGLKAGAGSAAALGGDIIAKLGQKAGNARYGENITSEQNNVRSAIRSGIASLGP